jgi:hypothetical protein
MPTDSVLAIASSPGEAGRSRWLAAALEDYHAYGPSGGPVAPDPVTERTWKRFFQEQEPMEALVAELEGRLVGFALMICTSALGPSCLLQDLFVEGDTARQGDRACLDRRGLCPREGGGRTTPLLARSGVEHAGPATV